MGVFRHPHLVRGTVHTPQGKFFISRGVVEVPDEVGEGNGWVRVDPDPDLRSEREWPPAVSLSVADPMPARGRS
jgi:hypothetical protein